LSSDAGGAKSKLARLGLKSTLVEADALALPLPDASLDLITIAFGFRNLANYAAGLKEMRRVLRPGGAVAILEFTQPPNKAFAAIYNWYSRRVLPVLGGAISGAPEAYEYLPESVRKFPEPEQLAAMMRTAGYAAVEWEYLTFGIVALHVGRVGRAKEGVGAKPQGPRRRGDQFLRFNSPGVET